MTQLSQDQIGDLGELLAAAAFSRPVAARFDRPLFRATRLGGKYPTVDIFVELLAASGSSEGFFLTQVKSTWSDTVATRKRLPVSVPVNKFNALVRLPVPTYLVGVDVRSEATHITAARRSQRNPISSISESLRFVDRFS